MNQRMTQHGTIRFQDETQHDYNVRFTDDGRWNVSRGGINIGYADTLSEVPDLILHYREAARARLVAVEAQAAERTEARRIMADMIRGATLKD